MKTLKDDLYRQHKTNFHLIPGRLRVGIPGLSYNQKLAYQIAHRLARFPGIKMSYANPLTGQVLIIFDPYQTDLKLLLLWISRTGARNKGKADPAPEPSEPLDHHLLKQSKTKPGLQEIALAPLPAAAPTSRPVPASKRQEPTSWHTLDGPKALALLGSSIESGLSRHTAQERMLKFGPNELSEGQKFSFWHAILASLNGFMTKLLLVAGGMSLWVGETTDAAVIAAIVAIQATVETAQSYRAEKSLDNLKELSAPLATVLREGKVQKIPGKELVPGDILYLDAGDMVPADALIIEAVNLTTNEACLTGESIPVVKDRQGENSRRIPIADQTNMLFSGTSIIGGRASAMVVATGMQTELGRIARLLSDVQNKQTNLQKQLDDLGKKITYLVVFSVGSIAIINLLRKRPLLEVLRSGISLAVGAVPEGLPAVLTVALSAGVQRMARRNALVRNISAVETLGSATVICTDKTGTLTKNEMTVKELYVDQTFYRITGNGYRPNGKILRRGDEGQEDLSPSVIKTLKAATLCNNAGLEEDPEGKWKIRGDPTEAAILTAAAKAGLWWQDLQEKHCRHKEAAFDAKRRLMTVVCLEPDGEYGIYVKGAPDTLINYCSSVLKNPRIETDDPCAQEAEHLMPALDLKTRQKILAANENMARKALRVLAVAYKKLPPGTDFKEVDLETELVFCGLLGMTDTPRRGVREAIQKCQAAGIKVVMITGDHQKTAEAVADKLGILKQGKSVTGRELEQIPDAEFVEQVEDIAVYSRATPEQKLKIVRALKSRGQIVAMTGDGVNDAPAIKEADIGIAMGVSGTDVTREVAGMVLSDDNFVTIVSGIEEGRTVGMNLTKSVRYILSGNLGQLLTVFSSAALGLPTPLLPSQILWVNLVTESLPAISLTAEPPEENYMQRSPFNPEERFLADQGRAILRKGILFGLSTFGLYAAGLTWGRWPLTKARTMAFSQLVVNRVFSLLREQSTKNVKNAANTRNPLILPAAALSVSLFAATMYLPFMQPLFSTVEINLRDWLLLITNALATNKIDSSLGKQETTSRGRKNGG